jgi:hypothetical protein
MTLARSRVKQLRQRRMIEDVKIREEQRPLRCSPTLNYYSRLTAQARSRMGGSGTGNEWSTRPAAYMMSGVMWLPCRTGVWRDRNSDPDWTPSAGIVKVCNQSTPSDPMQTVVVAKCRRNIIFKRVVWER